MSVGPALLAWRHEEGGSATLVLGANAMASSRGSCPRSYTDHSHSDRPHPASLVWRGRGMLLLDTVANSAAGGGDECWLALTTSLPLRGLCIGREADAGEVGCLICVRGWGVGFGCELCVRNVVSEVVRHFVFTAMRRGVVTGGSGYSVLARLFRKTRCVCAAAEVIPSVL